MFIPPAAFDDHRAAQIAPATTPLLRLSFDKALPPTPSSFKKRMIRPRFLAARRRRTVSDGREVNDLTCERKANEDIGREDGRYGVPTKDDEQGKDEKVEGGIKGRKFLQWVRQQERERKAAEMRLEDAKDGETCFRVSTAVPHFCRTNKMYENGD
jgi:hypothetical protein